MLRAATGWREKDFLIRMKVKDIYNIPSDSDMIVQGIMDCLFVDTKGELYLIDYKCVNKNEKEIIKTYSYQINLYKEAISKTMQVSKDSIKAYIWDVNKQIAIDFNGGVI